MTGTKSDTKSGRTPGRTRAVGIAIGVCGAVIAAGALTSCSQSDGAAPREITMSGVGEAQGAPDVLTAKLAVEGRGADVSTALNQASDAARKVTDAMVAGGVPRTDIQTSDVQLNPRYGDGRAILDYTARQSTTVRIKDLGKASKLLGDAVTAGGDATRIDSVGFDLENDETLKKVARDKAFTDARNRADQFAALAGGRLGRVRTVTEGSPQTVTPAPRTFAAPAQAVPLEGGQESVKVTVTVVWDLE